MNPLEQLLAERRQYLAELSKKKLTEYVSVLIPEFNDSKRMRGIN